MRAALLRSTIALQRLRMSGVGSRTLQLTSALRMGCGLAAVKQVTGVSRGHVQYRTLSKLTPSQEEALVRDALFPRSLQQILPLLCERGSWGYAEAWVPESKSSDVLKCVSFFNDGSLPSANALRAAVEGTTCKIGDGPVGQAWASMNSTWEYSADGDWKSFVVPAVVDGEVNSVIQFYGLKDKDWPDQSITQDFADTVGPMLEAQRTMGEYRPSLNKNAQLSAGEHAHAATIDEDKMRAVYDCIIESGVFSPGAVYEDVSYVYNGLGLPSDYFDRFSVTEIAQHVMALMSSKKLAAAAHPDTGRDSSQEDISARITTDKGFCFMVPAKRESISEVERFCDELRSKTRSDQSLMISRYLSAGPAVPYGEQRLAVYVIDQEAYVQPPAKVNMLEKDINKVASQSFLQLPSTVVDKYQNLINEKQARLSPLIKILEPGEDGTTEVIIGMRTTTDGKLTTRGLNRIISETLGSHMWARRKYFNSFSNGLIFYSLYLEDAPRAKAEEFAKNVALSSQLPRDTCHYTLDLLTGQVLNSEEYMYSVCASNFAYYFLQSRNEDLEALTKHLSADEGQSARLRRVKQQMQIREMPESRIGACVNAYPNIVKDIFADFNETFSPKLNASKDKVPDVNQRLKKRIEREVVDEVDRNILETFLVFNSSVSKTNFYCTRKSTVSFRLEPSKFFTQLQQYPEVPYGMFMFLSNDFRGFHVRFRPVSRGGLRLIQSNGPMAVAANRQSLFNENYGLALTQNLKNKDIPEFGSKGTILLEPSNQSPSAGRFAFMKYISGMQDILLPHPDEIVDHHNKEEIIFCGPDEGTADLMQDAALYSKARGYKYWTSFTTGKPPSMGGVPHDEHGMTTRSVRKFVEGVLAKEGIAQESITKLQTGGPDGDLGSNEIRMSTDKTIAVVDGSGVVFDPQGLNRDELTRLATARQMVKHFDESKLSTEGKFVSVDAEQVELPDGTIVESGTVFRNEFHFHPLADADLFVPCGGRPRAVNGSNVAQLFDENGKPKFKYIVEGANLFITEDARDVLENAGVILYKDASTNKGGVTSSSFEVLASLCMTDAEHEEHMRERPDGTRPEFYKQYVNEIISIVEENARLEFEAIHAHVTATGHKRHRTTDAMSATINDLNIACSNSSLWDRKELRHSVLQAALPQSLQDLLGLETILQRLPDDYLRAVFGYYLASRYIYLKGMRNKNVDFVTTFFEYLSDYGEN